MRAIGEMELKINQLTPGLIEELGHYLNCLINKRVVRKPGKLRQDWAGGLKDVEMTSMELQKKAL
ncbi:MAG: DUF2281 domain-containing protein [Prolixibacteraceae bacterium]|nr:DUF2281 domain-containing protein [Prolixibacteraceae bacterium]